MTDTDSKTPINYVLGADGFVDIDATFPQRSEPDIPALRAVLQNIKDHPDKWNQATWISLDPDAEHEQWMTFEEGKEPTPLCGTKHCAAGKAVVLSGVKLQRNILVTDHGTDWEQVYLLDGHPVLQQWWCGPTGGSSLASNTVFQVAKRLLGLDETQAVTLFHGDNTVEDIERIIDNIERGVDSSEGVHRFGEFGEES